MCNDVPERIEYLWKDHGTVHNWVLHKKEWAYALSKTTEKTILCKIVDFPHCQYLVIASLWDIFPHYYKHVSLFVTMATTCALPLNMFLVCKKHLYTWDAVISQKECATYHLRW